MKEIIDRLHEKEKKEQKSGVTLKDYYPLKFRDHVWSQTDFTESKGEWKYTKDELVSLVEMVVKVDDEDLYLLKNKYGLSREAFKTKIAVYEKLVNDYHNFQYRSLYNDITYQNNNHKSKFLVYGKVIDVKFEKDGKEVEVEKYIGTIPSVYTTVDYPMHPEFMCADTGQFVLNLGSTYQTMEGKPNYEKASRFLRMIYRNLCNYPAMLDEEGKELTDEEERLILYVKVFDNSYTEDERDFKFVVNWCAAIIQNPGINLMTNIWFAGEYQGIGKGTLVNFMKAILGSSRVGLCKPNIITGSFNKILDGKFILEINEKQQGISPSEMTNWLKGFSQEREIQIEAKGQDPFTRINTINVIGTAQTPEDVFKIEDEDRRNVIFRTVTKDSDPTKRWKKYAVKIAIGLEKEEGWAESVAFVLERVDIDWEMMGTAYHTRGYKEVKTTQMERENPLLLWAQEEFKEFAKKGSKMKASKLFESYQIDCPKTSIRTQQTFNKKLKELENMSNISPFVLTKPDNVLTIEIFSE